MAVTRREKGLDLLLEAAAWAEERGYPLSFIVVGPTTDTPMVLSDTRVILTGPLWGLEKEIILHAAAKRGAVGLIPSRYEGFGLTALEYLHRDTPVVTCRGPIGVNEILGRSAHTFKCGDPRSLAEALWKLVDEDRYRKTAKGQREKAEERGLLTSDRWVTMAKAMLEADQ